MKLMKTTKYLRSFLAVVLLTFGAIACRRDFPVYEPETAQGPAFIPMLKTTPALLPVSPLNILSEIEIKGEKPWRGHVLGKLGSEHVGSGWHVGWEALSTLGEVLWEAFDYHKTECNFEDVYNQLIGIQNQLKVIESETEENQRLLTFEMDKLEAFLKSTDLDEQFTYVQSAMSPALDAGLISMANVAKAYKADSVNVEKRGT